MRACEEIEARKRKGREKEGHKDFRANCVGILDRELSKTQPQELLNGGGGMLEWRPTYLTQSHSVG